MAAIIRSVAVSSSRVAAARMGASVASRDMATGSVKWFNVSKGFGFIAQDEAGSADIFVHQSVIKSNGFRYLKEGEKVTYDVEKTDKGIQAANVRDENGNEFNRPPAPQQRSFTPRSGGSGPRSGSRGPRRGEGESH